MIGCLAKWIHKTLFKHLVFTNSELHIGRQATWEDRERVQHATKIPNLELNLGCCSYVACAVNIRLPKNLLMRVFPATHCY